MLWFRLVLKRLSVGRKGYLRVMKCEEMVPRLRRGGDRRQRLEECLNDICSHHGLESGEEQEM